MSYRTLLMPIRQFHNLKLKIINYLISNFVFMDNIEVFFFFSVVLLSGQEIRCNYEIFNLTDITSVLLLCGLKTYCSLKSMWLTMLYSSWCRRKLAEHSSENKTRRYQLTLETFLSGIQIVARAVLLATLSLYYIMNVYIFLNNKVSVNIYISSLYLNKVSFYLVQYSI